MKTQQMHFSNMSKEEAIQIVGYIVKAFSKLGNYFFQIVLLTSNIEAEKI